MSQKFHLTSHNFFFLEFLFDFLSWNIERKNLMLMRLDIKLIKKKLLKNFFTMNMNTNNNDYVHSGRMLSPRGFNTN